MLGKLLKYEFRATGRIFLPMFGALIVMSLLTIPLSFLSEAYENTGGIVGFLAAAPNVIAIIIASALTGIVGITALILMIRRFDKNLLGDEGYLMFTLPAGTDSLIISKLIVCIAWYFASSIVASIGVAFISKENIFDTIAGFGRMIISAFTNGGDFFIQCLLVVLCGLIAIVCFILAVYMCIALAMRFNKHRGAATVGIFLLYMIVLMVLFVLLVLLMNAMSNAGTINNIFGSMRSAAALNMTLLFADIILLAITVGEYFVTRYMLKNKLNLE